MKFKFLKKAAAFVTSAVMAVGTLAALPEESLPLFGIVVSAEETESSVKIQSVSLGYDNSACITEYGDLYVWGENYYGTLGNGLSGGEYRIYDEMIDSNIPVFIMSDVVSVCLGDTHSACVTANGDLYTWGKNDNGQLGNGSTTSESQPQKIMSNVISVSLGNRHSACITTNGDLYLWGSNGSGELGNNSTNNSSVPIKIMSDVKNVSLGSGHSSCITSNGELYTWGSNYWGQLGDGTINNSLVPKKIMDDVIEVSLGSAVSSCITSNNDLYTWGCNHEGQLGNGHRYPGDTYLLKYKEGLDSNIPIKIMSNVSSVSIDGRHGLCIDNNGDLYVWGSNSYGELGNNSYKDNYTPIKILSDVMSVDSGTWHSACITKNNDLYTWGNNKSGQCGIASTVYYVRVPNQVKIPLPDDIGDGIIPVTVKAIKDNSLDNAPEYVAVEEAKVCLFTSEGTKEFTTGADGVAYVSLRGLTESQKATATISAYKAWNVAPKPDKDLRYPLQDYFKDSNGKPLRYICELHSETIDKNGNWVGAKISDIKENPELIIDEPRMLFNMSISYFEPVSESLNAVSNLNAVKQFMNKLSLTLAEATDGHVMLNQVLIGKTTNRRDMYFSTYYNTDNDLSLFLESVKLASMADIQIRSTSNEDAIIHSNATINGYNNMVKSGNITGGLFSNFKTIPVFSEYGQTYMGSFGRIELGWKDSSTHKYDSTQSLNRDLYLTAAHESGHYILGLYDEYLSSSGKRLGDYFDRPIGMPWNFGLMDNHRQNIEISTAYDYDYLKYYPGTEKQTKQFSDNGKSCEEFLDEYLQSYIGYKCIYTHSPKSRRKAVYPYAALDESDYFYFDGSVKAFNTSEATEFAINESLGDTEEAVSEQEIYEDASETKQSLGTLSVTNDGQISFKPADDGEYQIYCKDLTRNLVSKLGQTQDGEEYTCQFDFESDSLYDLIIKSKKEASYVLNTYEYQKSQGNGTYFNSLNNCICGYLSTDSDSNYSFMFGKSQLTNDNYYSINETVEIICNTEENNGELYSVADINSDIDYKSVSWFRYYNGVWTKLDTDISAEENMNLGARCDYTGNGIYALMAKTAAVSDAVSVTNLEYSILDDQDGIVNITFDDSNTTTKYYNIYSSLQKFDSSNYNAVNMNKEYAGSDFYSIYVGDRNTDIYVAVEAVAEDGSKSPLSEIIKATSGEADSDMDGIPDWYCDKYSLWPTDNEEKDIAASDDDGDGVTNLEEYLGQSDPQDPYDPVINVQSVSIVENNVSISQKDTITIHAEIFPENSTNKKVTWSVKDPAIAQVKTDGLECTLTAVKSGKTVINVITDDGGYIASVEINIAQPEISVPVIDTVEYGILLSEIELTNGWKWVDPTIKPNVGTNAYQAYLDVSDNEYDYSGVDGYDSSTGRIIRNISVTVVGEEMILSIEIQPENIIVSYGYDADNISKTEIINFDEVTVEMVEWMYSHDKSYTLLIDFVNTFTALSSSDNIILTEAQVKAIEYVLAHDYGD